MSVEYPWKVPDATIKDFEFSCRYCGATTDLEIEIEGAQPRCIDGVGCNDRSVEPDPEDDSADPED